MPVRWPTPPPAGFDSTLVRNSSDGSDTLTSHASAEVLTFRADRTLASDVDRNANTLNFAYPDGGRLRVGPAQPDGRRRRHMRDPILQAPGNQNSHAPTNHSMWHW